VEHVLLNLLSNALQAMATGGTLTVRTRTEFCREDPARLDTVRHFGPGTQIIVIEVQDTGPGIPVEHLPRIFDAFFTTKAASTGTGLGLSIVKKIIDLHGARIELENALPTGVVARVMLRAAAE
jgi:two-component system cell cycle sensor histidine kinase/response regulator CckA